MRGVIRGVDRGVAKGVFRGVWVDPDADDVSEKDEEGLGSEPGLIRDGTRPEESCREVTTPVQKICAVNGVC